MTKETIQIQAAWFFKNDYSGNFEELSLKIKKELGDSKFTQHLPVPSNAPGEIPRLILAYDNFNINFSKNRADIFSKDFSLIKNQIEKITDIIINDLKLEIVRLGYVKNFSGDGDIKDMKSLLNTEKISSLDIKEINIRINTKLNLAPYECNNIQAISNGKMKKEGTEKDVLIISRDINTVKDKYNFDKNQTQELISKFNDESDKLII